MGARLRPGLTAGVTLVAFLLGARLMCDGNSMNYHHVSVGEN